MLRNALLALVALTLLAGAGLVVAVASLRPFQVDEVEHVHAAYEVRAGRLLYRDVRQSHGPLLYLLLAPVIEPDEPVASFFHARAVSTAMLLGTVLLVGIAGRRLSTPLGGALAAGLALVHTTMAGRGIEVRPDGGVALCVAAALAVELSPLERRRRYVIEALLLSAAFLFTDKAAFACFAFGCLWLTAAVRERAPGLLLRPLAAWVAPLAVAAGVMAWLGNLGDFLRLAVVDVAATATGLAAYGPRSFWPGDFLVNEGARNLLFSALAVAGLASGGLAWYRTCSRARRRLGATGGDAPPRGLRFTAFLAAVLVASLWCNPFPFPYLHLTVLPTLAVLAAAVVANAARARGLDLGRPAGAVLLLGILWLAAAPGVPYLVRLARLPQEPQLETLRQVQRTTAPGDPVFDMAGLYFRPDAVYAYVTTINSLERYRTGELPPISEELRRHRAVAYIASYRTDWLGAEERAFLDRHFVHYDRNLYLLGCDLSGLAPGEARRFEALAGRRFRHDGAARIRVDGRLFGAGFLARGWHRIELASRGGAESSSGPERLILETPPPVAWPPRPPRELYEDFDWGPWETLPRLGARDPRSLSNPRGGRGTPPPGLAAAQNSARSSRFWLDQTTRLDAP